VPPLMHSNSQWRVSLTQRLTTVCSPAADPPRPSRRRRRAEFACMHACTQLLQLARCGGGSVVDIVCPSSETDRRTGICIINVSRRRLSVRTRCVCVCVSCWLSQSFITDILVSSELHREEKNSHADPTAGRMPVFEKTCATTQKKRKKSCFLDFEKNCKRRTYSFTGHLITQPLIHNYQ